MKNLHTELLRIYEEVFPDVYCKKFSGALAVELIRQALIRSGIPVSPRDVFIRGVDIEIDLIVPRRGARPKHNLVYEPEDVVAALEVKYRGMFFDGIIKLKANFRKIILANKRIQCMYVTLIETKGYKGAVLTRNLGYPAYTLNWWYASKKDKKPSGDWEKLTGRLKSVLRPVAIAVEN